MSKEADASVLNKTAADYENAHNVLIFYQDDTQNQLGKFNQVPVLFPIENNIQKAFFIFWKVLEVFAFEPTPHRTTANLATIP